MKKSTKKRLSVGRRNDWNGNRDQERWHYGIKEKEGD
jgi:hypothetical protein